MDIVEIDKKISDIENNYISQDIVTTTIVHGELDMLYWVRNGGKLRTDNEIKNKIERLKEEMIPLGSNDMWYKEKKARISVLESILKN